MTVTIWTPDARRQLAEAAYGDFGRLMFDGFGIMVTDEQLEARGILGFPGPRASTEEAKYHWWSGGQRAGKTVLAAGCHAEACLYKIGYDTTSRRQWDNYAYATLAIAPTDQLTLRLWSIMEEVGKGTSDAQYDRRARRSRGGAFIGKFKVGNTKFGGVALFDNGARVDFRSSEGRAYRLEGGQWWFGTWDEWASQPDREIEFVRTDVMAGRLRDHDGKLVALAWPKPETEHHLMKVLREVQSGYDRDSRIVYLDAAKAYFTNQDALAVELRRKSKAQIERTIHGRPAGGAGIEFKEWQLDNLFTLETPWPVRRENGYDYLHSWDLGLAHDATVGITWRISIVDGRRVVTPEHKARIVDYVELPGGPTQSLDAICLAITRQQQLYGGITALDATSMGGMMAVRQLDTMDPRPYAFVSRSNDRIYGNMRLAAITNGVDLLTWGRDPEVEEDDRGSPWGLVEAPEINPLRDQLAAFDRDDKKLEDDRTWAFLVGAWYIRRFYAIGSPRDFTVQRFDVRDDGRPPVRRRTSSQLVAPAFGSLDEQEARRGIVYIGWDADRRKMVRVRPHGGR